MLQLDELCTDNSCLQCHRADDIHKCEPEKSTEEHYLERLTGLFNECGIKFEAK